MLVLAYRLFPAWPPLYLHLVLVVGLLQAALWLLLVEVIVRLVRQRLLLLAQVVRRSLTLETRRLFLLGLVRLLFLARLVARL